MRRPDVRQLVALLGVLGLAGCPAVPPENDTTHAVIGPAGGLLSSFDSVLTIAIPPGALEEDIELFIERTDDPPDVLDQAYVVRPNPSLRYDATVTYRAPSLPDDVEHLAVGAIDPIAYEEDRGRWGALPVLRIDHETKRVSGLDAQVSIFYALVDRDEVGEHEPEVPESTASGGEVETSGGATSDGAGLEDPRLDAMRSVSARDDGS